MDRARAGLLALLGLSLPLAQHAFTTAPFPLFRIVTARHASDEQGGYPRPVEELSIREMKLELQRRGIDHRDLLERTELEQRIVASRLDCRPLRAAEATLSSSSMQPPLPTELTREKGPQESPTTSHTMQPSEERDYAAQVADLLRQSQSSIEDPTPSAPPKSTKETALPKSTPLSVSDLPEIPAGGYKEVLKWAQDAKALCDEDLARILSIRGLEEDALQLFGRGFQRKVRKNRTTEKISGSGKEGRRKSRREEVEGNAIREMLDLLSDSNWSTRDRRKQRRALASLLAGDVGVERSIVEMSGLKQELQRDHEIQEKKRKPGGLRKETPQRHQRRSKGVESWVSRYVQGGDSNASEMVKGLADCSYGAELAWANSLSRREKEVEISDMITRLRRHRKRRQGFRNGGKRSVNVSISSLHDTPLPLSASSQVSSGSSTSVNRKHFQQLLDEWINEEGKQGPETEVSIGKELLAIQNEELAELLAEASIAVQLVAAHRTSQSQRRRGSSAPVPSPASASSVAIPPSLISIEETHAPLDEETTKPPLIGASEAESEEQSEESTPRPRDALPPEVLRQEQRRASREQRPKKRELILPPLFPKHPMTTILGQAKQWQEQLLEQDPWDDALEAEAGAATGAVMSTRDLEMTDTSVGRRKKDRRALVAASMLRRSASLLVQLALALGRWAGGRRIPPDHSLLLCVGCALLTRRGLGGFFASLLLLRFSRAALEQQEQEDYQQRQQPHKEVPSSSL